MLRDQLVKRILIVDDESAISDLLKVYLTNEGYEIDTSDSGKSALKKIENEHYNLALLDIMLPDIDGLQLLTIIRQSQNYPVIMLTAKDEETDKITGLTIGADDYITKPFKPLEVVARVKAQLRRVNQYDEVDREKQTILNTRGLTMDISKHQVTFNEQPINLTPKEFSILQLLLNRRGQAIPSEEIFQQVWGETYYTASNNTIMVHIRHLREKMHDSSEKPKYIKTVWGVGYKID